MSFFSMKYKFHHWLFQWKIDDEGDITLSVAGLFHLTKYKEHTIIRFGKMHYANAPQYIKIESK